MPNVQDRQGNLLDVVALTIAAGQTVSNAGRLFGCSALGLFLPAMTGTILTFQVSNDDNTYYPLNDPSAVSPTALSINNNGALAAYPLYAPYFVAWRWIKVVSNSAEASSRSILISPYDLA